MNDDFNSPILIAQLFEAVRHINASHNGKLNLTERDIKILSSTMHAFCFDVLGLENVQSKSSDNSQQDDLIQLLIELRNQARANKDFKQSDEIRDKLLALKIQLKDTPQGTTYETIS